MGVARLARRGHLDGNGVPDLAVGQPVSTDTVWILFLASDGTVVGQKAIDDTVMAELEHTFGCPVIEAYGMTESTHQMTSNPLPPAERKPGSVGHTPINQAAASTFSPLSLIAQASGCVST